MTKSWFQSSLAVRAFKKSLGSKSLFEESFFLNLTPSACQSEGLPRRFQLLSLILLSAVIFGAVWIPRFSLGGIFHYYSFDLKIEDMAMLGLVIIFACCRPVFRFNTGQHLMETVFICFLIAANLSIAAGMAVGSIDKPVMSLFYLAKWFEYFLVFAITARLVRYAGAWPAAAIFFVMGILLAAYGYFEHFYPMSQAAYPNYYRLYERAPFHGDANHVGGILVLWLSFFSAVFLRFSKVSVEFFKRRLPLSDKMVSALLVCSILFVFFPFIWTFSRKSYFAFAGAYCLLFFLPGVSRRRWLFLACLLMCGGLLIPTRLAERVRDLASVMNADDPYHSSWAGNMDVWRRCFLNFDRLWLFGAGLGARHRLFYESQYVMTLTETGMVGFGILMALLLLPTVTAYRSLKDRELGWIAGAFLAAWAGFLLHNISCVSLTVSKLAVVWWGLAGAVLGLLHWERR